MRVVAPTAGDAASAWGGRAAAAAATAALVGRTAETLLSVWTVALAECARGGVMMASSRQRRTCESGNVQTVLSTWKKTSTESTEPSGAATTSPAKLAASVRLPRSARSGHGGGRRHPGRENSSEQAARERG